jgi:hypothetical protein
MYELDKILKDRKLYKTTYSQAELIACCQVTDLPGPLAPS